MSKVKRALEITWLVEIGMIIAMVLLSDWFYSIWIGDSVHISLELSIAMAFFFAIQGIGNIYMYLINGIGTIRIQIIVYVIFAILAWPLMHFACQYYGLIGILVAPSLVILVQAILGKIQLERALSGKCNGIWSK